MRQAGFWPYMHPDSKRNWRTQHHLAPIDMKCPIMPLAFSRALASFLPCFGLVCLFFHPSGDDDPNWLSSASVWVWLPLWNHTNPYSNLCQCLQTACHLPINTLSPWADSRVQLPHAAIVLPMETATRSALALLAFSAVLAFVLQEQWAVSLADRLGPESVGLTRGMTWDRVSVTFVDTGSVEAGWMVASLLYVVHSLREGRGVQYRGAIVPSRPTWIILLSTWSLAMARTVSLSIEVPLCCPPSALQTNMLHRLATLASCLISAVLVFEMMIPNDFPFF